MFLLQVHYNDGIVFFFLKRLIQCALIFMSVQAVFKKKNNDRGVITFANTADKAVAVSVLSSATRKDGKSYKVKDVDYVEESRTHKRQRETAVYYRLSVISRLIVTF